MEVFAKKIRNPMILVISTAFAAGALAYFMGYKVAMNKFNSIISYNREKEQMYYKLSEVDRAVRQEYIRDIDEPELMTGLSCGYISGLGDEDCMYLSPQEYKEYIAKKQYDEDAVACCKLEDDIGYIKIKSLTPESGNMFSNQVREFVENGVQKIVLDIRDLSGYELDPVNKCLDCIVAEGDTVSTVNKKGESEIVHKTIADGLDAKFCVVVNSGTSGTPELIASALKDSGRGKVVGEKTAGNAVLKKAVPLSDGSGVVFPVAHYVTKGGQQFTDIGIVPDVEIGAGEPENSLEFDDTQDYRNDTQISEAVKCLSLI